MIPPSLDKIWTCQGNFGYMNVYNWLEALNSGIIGPNKRENDIWMTVYIFII